MGILFKSLDKIVISALHLTFLERHESHDGPNLCLLFLFVQTFNLTFDKLGDEIGLSELTEDAGLMELTDDAGVILDIDE